MIGDIGHAVLGLLVASASAYALVHVRGERGRSPYLPLPLGANVVFGLVTFANAMSGARLDSDVTEIATSGLVLSIGFTVGAVAVHRIPLESNELLESARRLQDAEQLLRELLENVPAGIVRVDAAGRVEYANREFAAISGAPDAARTGDDLFANPLVRGQPTVEARVRGVLQGQAYGPVERILDAPDGARAYSALGIPLFDTTTKRVKGGLYILVDLTAVKRAAAEAGAARAQMQHNERLAMIGTLMASVAHEIGNSVQVAELAVATERMLLHDIETSSKEERTQKLVHEAAKADESIARSVHALHALTLSLKHVSRTGSTARVDLAPDQLVQSVLTLAHGRLKHTVEVRAELAATRHVLGNEGELGQVLLNLLLNAAEAMEPLPGTHVVTLRTRDDSDGGVRFDVTDNGPGIEPAVLAKLFTPFFTTKPEGTGLGLSISQRLVREHGGELAVESVVGRGTTFSFALPAPTA